MNREPILAVCSGTAIFLFHRFLPDGKVFDASNAPGRKPIAFKLGARQVIKGWEEVLRLMNVRRTFPLPYFALDRSKRRRRKMPQVPPLVYPVWTRDDLSVVVYGIMVLLKAESVGRLDEPLAAP